MNNIETAADRHLPHAEGGFIRPLELPRAVMPTLATPAAFWGGVTGAYFVADYVFGDWDAAAAGAVAGLEEMGVDELVTSRQRQIRN